MSVNLVAPRRVGWENDKSVLEGDMKAPYSGNPDRMTSTNRRAVKRSSEMKRKSSMYRSRRYDVSVAPIKKVFGQLSRGKESGKKGERYEK